MPIVSGSRLGLYEVVSPLGAGGMSACGHTEPRTCKSEARCQRQFAPGVGPRRQ